MLKWLSAKVKVSVDLHVVVAWLTVVGYAIFNKAPFSSFWPAIIALFGLHTIHNAVNGEHHD
jgi:hypothetical protein